MSKKWEAVHFESATGTLAPDDAKVSLLMTLKILLKLLEPSPTPLKTNGHLQRFTITLKLMGIMYSVHQIQVR